jgi:predicted TIM-barrel fold metal-dependent hydrolase
MTPSRPSPPPSDLVIDAHTHIASVDFIPPSFVDGIVANVQLALASKGVGTAAHKVKELYMTKFQDPLCDELVSEMDAAGIDRAILLAADFTYALKDVRLTIKEILEHHHRVQKRHPGRFAVFAGVDPRWGADGIALFEHSVRDLGFSGLKVYPPCGFPGSDPRLYPYYEICAQWRIPVLVHIGGTCPALAFDTASPVMLDQAARDFPQVNFILAHGSVSYVEECAMMCAFRPNVYLDVSGFQTAEPSQLEHLFRRGFTHKIVFGTDWPLFRLQGRLDACLARLCADDGPLSGLRDYERHAFLGGTTDRLLSARRPPNEAGLAKDRVA